MEKADVLVALVGVIVLAAAGAGIAFFQVVPQPTEFRITWASSQVAFAPQSGTSTGETPAQFTFNVNATNVTRIDFTVSVTGAGPRTADDTVSVEVTGPMNRRFTTTAQLTGQQTSTVELRLDGELRAPPSTTGPVYSFTQGDAERQVFASFSDTNATGAWTVRVTATTTAAVPNFHTEGHSIAVSGALMRFDATVTSAGPTRTR
ncbi:MAG: hypothetical protein HY556_00875 [Euryarchaeota archaeon]|nr:hypothetical protein [Euryarchaeota archaeon]